MSQKQPENFINATLNKYTIRAFDYEHMFFHKNTSIKPKLFTFYTTI